MIASWEVRQLSKKSRTSHVSGFADRQRQIVLLNMVIPHDVVKIIFSQVQFVFEVLRQGWIPKNFIDMVSSFLRFIVNCGFVWAIFFIVRHCYYSFLQATELPWESEASSPYTQRRDRMSIAATYSTQGRTDRRFELRRLRSSSVRNCSNVSFTRIGWRVPSVASN